MPIREFRCQKCNHKFETLVLPGEDENSLTCPECGAKNIKRCMSTFCGRVSDGAGGDKSVGSGCSTCSGGSCSTCH